MTREPDQIRAHIWAERESLRDNFDEIEYRVKDALDWKVWYRKNTALALGGIAAGSFVLSLLISKGSAPYSERMETDRNDHPNRESVGHLKSFASAPAAGPGPVRRLLDNTMAAILGVAADQFQDLMSEAIPGFKQHYSEAQQRHFE